MNLTFANQENKKISNKKVSISVLVLIRFNFISALDTFKNIVLGSSSASVCLILIIFLSAYFLIQINPKDFQQIKAQ